MSTHTSEGKVLLDASELTSSKLAKRLRTLANRPKTLANESLAKRLVGETTGYHLTQLWYCNELEFEPMTT